VQSTIYIQYSNDNNNNYYLKRTSEVYIYLYGVDVYSRVSPCEGIQIFIICLSNLFLANKQPEELTRVICCILRIGGLQHLREEFTFGILRLTRQRRTRSTMYIKEKCAQIKYHTCRFTGRF